MSLLSVLRKWIERPEAKEAQPPSAPASRDESRLRDDAEAILRAAVDSVDPASLVGEVLRARMASIPLDRKIHLAGFGNAAASMARAADEVFGPRIAEGVLIVPASARAEVPDRFDTFAGGWPVPDPAGVAGSRAIRQLARGMDEEDLLLCLVSGGGSSLLTIPPEGVPLEEIQELTRLVLERGVPYRDRQRVLRHLDQLKGGRLAAEAGSAGVLALVLSDLADDPLDQIAGGPLAPDRSRPADAVAVLKRHGLWKETPLAARGWLDRGINGELDPPPGTGHLGFDNVETVVVGSGHTAARAACAAAESRGYDAQIITAALGGEARKGGAFLAAAARSLARSRQREGKPLCLVASGDTDPAAKDHAEGGPNQELVLAAALEIAPLEPVLVAAMSTSGIDGTTGAAGAIATGRTLGRAETAGLDCREAVRRGDAGSIFSALDDLIVSGPTGTAAGDIRVVLLP
jgi:glycerate-2-kinase